MIWVLLWFQHRAQQWTDRAQFHNATELSAYAYRQAANWTKFYNAASGVFHATNRNLADVFGYETLDTKQESL